jgi:hypothetical protein
MSLPVILRPEAEADIQGFTTSRSKSSPVWAVGLFPSCTTSSSVLNRCRRCTVAFGRT